MEADDQEAAAVILTHFSVDEGLAVVLDVGIVGKSTPGGSGLQVGCSDIAFIRRARWVREDAFDLRDTGKAFR